MPKKWKMEGMNNCKTINKELKNLNTNKIKEIKKLTNMYMK